MSKYYDNIDDVKSKLVGTIVYYDGVPVVVKAADFHPEGGFGVITSTHLVGRTTVMRKIDDPLLNYMKFNLGYSNNNHGAVWWYRVPQRQYRQGLKAEQMRYTCSERSLNPGYNFQATESINRMLLNKYPDIDTIEKKFRDNEVNTVMAFHKNFAMSYDRIHDDMVVEYKGQLIGCIAKEFGRDQPTFKLMNEYIHLNESLKEAVGVF